MEIPIQISPKDNIQKKVKEHNLDPSRKYLYSYGFLCSEYNKAGQKYPVPVTIDQITKKVIY
jgi:hypothetical protein